MAVEQEHYPPHKTAIFRQVNLANPNAHHDALEFPSGDIVLLTYLMEGQEATVLQLPATASKAPQRGGYVKRVDALGHGRQLPKSAGPRHRWVLGSLYRLPPQPPNAVSRVTKPNLDSD
jgi:hypothetical protein